MNSPPDLAYVTVIVLSVLRFLQFVIERRVAFLAHKRGSSVQFGWLWIKRLDPPARHKPLRDP